MMFEYTEYLERWRESGGGEHPLSYEEFVSLVEQEKMAGLRY